MVPYHALRHLIQVAELGWHGACEAVGLEVLGLRGEGVAIVSHIAQLAWRG